MIAGFNFPILNALRYNSRWFISVFNLSNDTFDYEFGLHHVLVGNF